MPKKEKGRNEIFKIAMQIAKGQTQAAIDFGAIPKVSFTILSYSGLAAPWHLVLLANQPAWLPKPFAGIVLVHLRRALGSRP